ncbi:MAG: hypothetical protein HUU20_24340 [Pirellulales bacterium]|nr:hypothetical protein [Pirellulales bacterium]
MNEDPEAVRPGNSPGDAARPENAKQPVLTGSAELRRLVHEETFDLRRLDLAGFRSWLGKHLEQWQSDPVFLRRTRIRDIRRAHPELAAIEEEHRRAIAAEEASPRYPRCVRLEQELADVGKAIAGLTAALEAAVPRRRQSLIEKLEAFATRRQSLEREHASLVELSPHRQERLRIDAGLQEARSAIGIDREEARLGELQKEQGRRYGQAGKAFERLARAVVESHIVPTLIGSGERRENLPLRVLSGVTLGAARTELDQLVVRQPEKRGGIVDVLAMVEVKRNINDLARGFRQRQENLAWLSGDEGGYCAEWYRTGRFPSGHFDRQSVHEEEGEPFVFARRSFRRFRRDPATGFRLNRLYFITRSGTLWGVSAAVLARIRFRAATDVHWDLENEPYLRRLLGWCRRLSEPIETPDVLALYAARPQRGAQIVVVARETAG